MNDAVGGMGGHPQARTPNIDKLMSRGTRFTNGQVNVPICGPSRASCLSGIAPWTSGYFGYNFCRDPWWNNPILGESRTFMEHLGTNGYEVYGTGKIFHNHQENMEVWTHGHGHEVDWGPWSWDGQKPGTSWGSCVSHHSLPPHWDAELLIASLDDLPNIPPDPETGAPGYKGWRHGDGRPFKYNGPDDRDLMNDELNAQWAAEVLAQSHADPFLLCVGIGRPHAPLVAPKEYFDMFPLEDIQLAECLPGDLDDCAQYFRDGRNFTGGWGFRKYRCYLDSGGEAMLKRWVQAYFACITYADAQIGKVLDALAASEHADDTVVFFTSDNGYHMGEKEYLFKDSPWEESNRVPYVWAGPGVAEGQECRVPVSLLDVFPTLCDLADVEPNPNEGSNGLPLEGNSIVPLLTSPDGSDWTGPRHALSAVASDTPLDAGTPGDPEDQFYSLRTETHRFILCPNGETELYDHRSDPMEWHNLAGKPEHDGLKDELTAIIREAIRT